MGDLGRMSTDCVGVQTEHRLWWKKRAGWGGGMGRFFFSKSPVTTNSGWRPSLWPTSGLRKKNRPQTRGDVRVCGRPLDFEKKIAPRSRLHYVHILSFLFSLSFSSLSSLLSSLSLFFSSLSSLLFLFCSSSFSFFSRSEIIVRFWQSGGTTK